MEIRPVDLKSFISVTHLVHIAGPLHDVLEGSLTRDIIHQEDSLKRDLKQRQRKTEKVKALFGSHLINVLNVLIHKSSILKSNQL